MVLRYFLVNATTVNTKALIIYSGLRSPSELDLGQSTLSQMFGGSCPGTLDPVTQLYSNPCFFSHYQYGSFYERTTAGTLKFFTPYAGQSPTMGVTGIHTVGTVLNVVP
jgi:hypothetical protein